MQCISFHSLNGVPSSGSKRLFGAGVEFSHYCQIKNCQQNLEISINFAISSNTLIDVSSMYLKVRFVSVNFVLIP